MYSIEKNTKIKDILDDKRTYKFSRVPIYDGTIDNMVGVVLTKKIFKQAIRDSEVTIDSIMTPVFALNENIPVSKVLNTFIKKENTCLLYLIIMIKQKV